MNEDFVQIFQNEIQDDAKLHGHLRLFCCLKNKNAIGLLPSLPFSP